ncbi:zinc ribbon domain-containing protein [Thermoplasma volcanium]|uniref:zinc ribbon domain-containing protein n=1 Tax=Thermoplasma volcanium TaxID=50339 RepID=UPI0009FDF6A1|nr:zinc ribbon domain-containing protein [Thermoplasma volcanium]
MPVTYADTRNTSKECSRCGSIGNREVKSFDCPVRGHVYHADVYVCKGNTKDSCDS